MTEKTEENKSLEEIEDATESEEKPKPDKALQEAAAKVLKLLEEIQSNQEILNRNIGRIYTWVTQH